MPGTSGPEALTADKWPHTVPEPAVSMRSRPCVRRLDCSALHYCTLMEGLLSGECASDVMGRLGVSSTSCSGGAPSQEQ